MMIGHTNSIVFGFAFVQLSGSGALVVKPIASGPAEPLTTQGEKMGSELFDLQSQCSHFPHLTLFSNPTHIGADDGQA
jgi:hypothetical protein